MIRHRKWLKVFRMAQLGRWHFNGKSTKQISTITMDNQSVGDFPLRCLTTEGSPTMNHQRSTPGPMVTAVGQGLSRPGAKAGYDARIIVETTWIVTLGSGKWTTFSMDWKKGPVIRMDARVKFGLTDLDWLCWVLCFTMSLAQKCSVHSHHSHSFWSLLG